MAFSGDPTDYCSLGEQISKELHDESRFVAMDERKDNGVLTAEIISSVCHGKYYTSWRGVPIMKDPFDLTIIQQLLWELKPLTVIELGAFRGGSALWTADMLKIFGLKSRVISIDKDLSLLDDKARKSLDVEFIEGDLFQVETCFPGDFLTSLRHPWFLIEDAHVNLTGVLKYFDSFTQPGDYICVEDTNPLGPLKAGQGLIKEIGYEFTGPAKLNQLREFLAGRSGRYLVDQRYTDMFGYNATWNMNGYLKRV